MGRIAGDDPGYTFRLCRVETIPDEERTAEEILEGKNARRLVPTEAGIELVSVSTFIGEVMGKPASAMSWWGYRIGLGGVAKVLGEDPDAVIGTVDDAEALEALLKEHGVNPNMKLEEAGDRGNDAHGILELLAAGKAEEAVYAAAAEKETEYGVGVIDWWNAQIAPYLEDFGHEGYKILEVRSEVPVWSLQHRFAGTFDLALLWGRVDDEGNVYEVVGWEVLDLKTHKPANGYTKPGKGPGYISEAAQIRAYRIAFEELGFPTFGQRTVIARDRAYREQRWLEDDREVSAEFVLLLRAAYDIKTAFEAGSE